MFCVRFRQATYSGRDSQGRTFARDPLDPPVFLAAGFRRGPVRVGDMPGDLWTCPTRAGAGMVAQSPTVRAFAWRHRYVVDVVSLRFTLGWIEAALTMDDRTPVKKEQQALDRLRELDRLHRAKLRRGQARRRR